MCGSLRSLLLFELVGKFCLFIGRLFTSTTTVNLHFLPTTTCFQTHRLPGAFGQRRAQSPAKFPIPKGVFRFESVHYTSPHFREQCVCTSRRFFGARPVLQTQAFFRVHDVGFHQRFANFYYGGKQINHLVEYFWRNLSNAEWQCSCCLRQCSRCSNTVDQLQPGRNQQLNQQDGINRRCSHCSFYPSSVSFHQRLANFHYGGGAINHFVEYFQRNLSDA